MRDQLARVEGASADAAGAGPADPVASAGFEALARAEEQLRTRPAEAEALAREVASGSAGWEETGRALLLLGRAEYRRGATAPAAASLGQARKAFENADDRHGLLRTRLAQIRVARDLGNHAEAARGCDEALALAQELGDPEAEVDALYLRGSVCEIAGEYPEALDCLEAALAIARDQGLLDRQGSILTNIGTLHTDLGDHARALESLTAAHAILSEAAPGTRSELANVISLGTVYRSMGDVAAAREYFEQARDSAQDGGDPMVEAAAINNLANVYCSSGEWQQAGAAFRQAYRIAQKLGMRQYEIDNLDGLGQVHSALGEHQDALGAHGEALEIARAINDREGEIDGLINVGRDYLELGQSSEALRFLSEGLSLSVEIDRKHSIYRAHELLSEAYERAGDPVVALFHHREFYRAEKTVYNEEAERRTRRLAAKFELERARQEAEQYRLGIEITQKAREEAEAEVRERTRELEETQFEVITRLAVAAEYRDDDTGEHTRRVGRNAALMARALGWPEEEVVLMFTAARLHDVGKIGVSDNVLLKPGALGAEEFEQVKGHCTIGARILSGGQSSLLVLAEEVALSHHERWDGKGYPFGLAGDAIPLSARIVSVADVLDALTHRRPYKQAWSVEEALAEIERQAARQFDPAVVRACLEVFGGNGVSPLDPGDEWSSPLVVRPGERRARQQYARQELGSMKDRFDQLLAQRTRELEAVRANSMSAVRHMEGLAFSDALTGLGNRRAFDADLELEVARALRSSDAIGLLRLDLDSFKSVSDSVGHGRSDELLKAFAGTVQTSLRDWGRVYRIGGDEFAAILVHLSKDDFAEVREAVQAAARTVREQGQPEIVVSAGLAVLPEDAGTAEELAAKSDESLREEKSRRRSIGTSS